MDVHFDPVHGKLVCSQPEVALSCMTIEKWTSGFLILVFIYLEKFATRFPLKALELLRYLETTDNAANKFAGSGWLQYDHYVRKMWDTPTKCFSTINRHFWLRYITQGRESGTRAQQKNQGVCFDFNKGCSNRDCCIFQHRCSTCGNAAHGAHLCNGQNCQRSNEGQHQAKQNPQPFRGATGPGKDATQTQPIGTDIKQTSRPTGSNQLINNLKFGHSHSM